MRRFATRLIVMLAPVWAFTFGPMVHTTSARALPPGYVPKVTNVCPKATVIPAPVAWGPSRPHCM